jgi:hypothetical protein
LPESIKYMFTFKMITTKNITGNMGGIFHVT